MLLAALIERALRPPTQQHRAHAHDRGRPPCTPTRTHAHTGTRAASTSTEQTAPPAPSTHATFPSPRRRRLASRRPIGGRVAHVRVPCRRGCRQSHRRRAARRRRARGHRDHRSAPWRRGPLAHPTMRRREARPARATAVGPAVLAMRSAHVHHPRLSSAAVGGATPAPSPVAQQRARRTAPCPPCTASVAAANAQLGARAPNVCFSATSRQRPGACARTLRRRLALLDPWPMAVVYAVL